MCCRFNERRCQDVYEGIIDETKGYESLCTVQNNWNNAQSPDGSCGPECEEAKRLICYKNIRMCPSLRCGDIDYDGAVPWGLRRACEQQLSPAEALYVLSAESPASEAPPAFAFLRPLSDEDRDAAATMRKLSVRGGACGFVCKQQWKDLCLRNPVLCMQLK